MANLTIAQIEDALLAAIGADDTLKLVAAGGWTKTLESYGGQFEGIAEDLLVLYPCIFVLFESGQFSARTQRTVHADPLTFHVLVGDQNLRGNEAARRGGAGGIGAYAMATAMRNLLEGNKLGLDGLAPCHVTRIESELNAKDLSICSLAVETSCWLANI